MPGDLMPFPSPPVGYVRCVVRSEDFNGYAIDDIISCHPREKTEWSTLTFERSTLVDVPASAWPGITEDTQAAADEVIRMWQRWCVGWEPRDADLDGSLYDAPELLEQIEDGDHRAVRDKRPWAWDAVGGVVIDKRDGTAS